MFKNYIVNKLAELTELDASAVLSALETPPEKKMGDLALPCFKLSKIMRKAPPMIADSLKVV